MIEYETIELTQAQFNSLLEYSLSIPTGKTIGKKWRCHERVNGEFTERWFLREYVEDSQPGYVGIKSLLIKIVQ